jgi:hypothetical protein
MMAGHSSLTAVFMSSLTLIKFCLFVGFASHLQGLLHIEIDERSSSSLNYYFCFALHNFTMVFSTLASCPFNCIVAGWVVSSLFSSTLLLCVIGAAELVHKIM